MNRSEQGLHIAAVEALVGPLHPSTGKRVRARGMLPQAWLCWHTPNGGGRSKVEASVFKAMGVLAGMPDLFLLGPGATMVAIEFKAPPVRLRSGGPSRAKPRLSPAQRARQSDLEACGVPYLVVDDLAEMIRALKALGVPLRGRAL